MILVAVVITMAIGVVLGVAWGSQATGCRQVLRPILDAAQTMPAFVYLVPFVALFAASRFTAIVAAVVYAVPGGRSRSSTDGIRGVSPDVDRGGHGGRHRAVAADHARCSCRWLAESLLLATNQGVFYVLSMVVVGGLVGAGALGFDVVAGFSQGERLRQGPGRRRSRSSLLGIMLDRITQARRHAPGESDGDVSTSLILDPADQPTTVG